MAEKIRYNKIIDLLEHGKPVFSTSTVPNGNLDDLTYIAENRLAALEEVDDLVVAHLLSHVFPLPVSGLAAGLSLYPSLALR